MYYAVYALYQHLLKLWFKKPFNEVKTTILLPLQNALVNTTFVYLKY